MKKNPEQKDLETGARVKAKRIQKGMTQTELADACGIKFQQIQKYETGANRLSVSRLFEIADALETPICWFLVGDDYEKTNLNSHSIMADAPALRLVSNFNKMNPVRRMLLRGIAKVFANNTDKDDD